MKRFSVLADLLVASLILASCGEVADGSGQRSPVEATATYVAARERLVATRRAETPETTATQRASSTSNWVNGAASAPSSTSTPTPVVSAPVPSVESLSDADFMSYFPTEAQLPDGFYMWKDEEISAEEIAAAKDDPAAHLQRLEQWGFRRLHQHGCKLPASLTITNRMNIFFVSVYEWGSPDQARAAAAFNLEASFDCECQTKIGDVVLPGTGDEVTRYSSAPRNPDGYHITLIYIRFGSVIVCVEAHAEDVDPMPEAVAFVQANYGSR